MAPCVLHSTGMHVWGDPRCLVCCVDVLSGDKTDVLPADTTDVLSADTTGLGLCKVDLLGTIFEILDLLKVDLLGNDFGRF